MGFRNLQEKLENVFFAACKKLYAASTNKTSPWWRFSTPCENSTPIFLRFKMETIDVAQVRKLRQKLTGWFLIFPKYMLFDKIQYIGITCSDKNCRKLIIYAWNDTTLHWKGKRKKVYLTILLLKYFPTYLLT